MKKIIVTFFLTIFIIFNFGITTSNAWIIYDDYLYRSSSRIKSEYKKATEWITSDTNSSSMRSFLSSKKYLTGITTTVRDTNLYLLCRERTWALSDGSEYVDINGLKDGGDLWDQYEKGTEITFPGVDTNGNGKIDEDETLEEDGYAAAYILAGREEDKYYVKNDSDQYDNIDEGDERQYAWYLLKEYQTGDGDRTNDLYNIAIAYQNHKKNEKDTTVTDTNANTQITEDNIIYGPIVVTYSYSSRKRYQ